MPPTEATTRCLRCTPSRSLADSGQGLGPWGLGACRMAWESAERSDAPAYALSPGRMSATLKPLEAAELRDAKDSQCVSGYDPSSSLELWNCGPLNSSVRCREPAHPNAEDLLPQPLRQADAERPFSQAPHCHDHRRSLTC